MIDDAGEYRTAEGARAVVYCQTKWGNWLGTLSSDPCIWAGDGKFLQKDYAAPVCGEVARFDIVGPWTAPSPPDPGEGWRLLDGPWNGREPEPKQKGDWCCITGFGWDEAVHRPDDSAQKPPHFYRRPLPSAPEGWELVESGEVREGDMHTICETADAGEFKHGIVVGEGSGMLGRPVINWRCHGLAASAYILRRVVPEWTPAAGDWVRCPDGEVRKIDNIEGDTGYNGPPDAPSYSCSLRHCRPVRWEPLDADGLRKLFRDHVAIKHTETEGEVRVVEFDPMLFSQALEPCIRISSRRCYKADDLMKQFTYADGPEAGQPVGRAVTDG